MPNLLFVCSSDRTRGPLAAACFQYLAKVGQLEDWNVASAGLHAHHGQMIAAEVREALAEIHLEPLKIGVQELSPKLIKSSDLILCMTSNQEDEITSRFISARSKTKTLMSVAGSSADVFDPNKLGIEKFRQCLQMMWPALEQLVERLK